MSITACASRPRTTVRLGVASVVTGLLATGCAIQPNDNTLSGQVATGDDGYTISVHFSEVENLVPNSQVLMDDVVVGTVSSLKVEDWHAVAEIDLLDSVPVSRNATFSVGQKTLLGAQYVSVTNPPPVGEEPAGSLLGEGDVVPLGQTGRAPATEQVLGGVALLLNNGGLSQLSTITAELTTTLKDREMDTRDLITRSNELVGALDDTKDDIIDALDSLDRLSRGLAGDRDRIARAIDRVGPGLRALEEERARLVDALTTSGRASTTAVRVIRASQRALLANLESLGPILANLGRAATRVPEALKIAITVPFPAMTTEKTLRGDYSNLFATIDVSSQSLADLLLGTGTLPSFQSADPVRGPLGPSSPGSEGRDNGGGAGGGQGDGGRGDGGGGSPDVPPGSGDGDADDDANSCLLGLLGDCS